MSGVERNPLSWLLEHAPQAASAVAITVGILVLCGWMFDLTLLESAFSGLVAMKVNTALGFILAGISLLNTSPHDQLPLPRIVSLVCASSVLLLGLLTTGEYLSGKNFGIDQLVMRDITNFPGNIPGRMAINTAASFTALGAALVLLSRKQGGFMQTIHVLAIGTILVAGVAMVGYGYDIEAFLRVKMNYTPMAIHAAAIFVFLGLGILSARPDYPFRRIMTSDSAAGSTARLLLPAAVGFPLVIGWGLTKGFQAGYLSETVGMAIFAVVNMCGLSALIQWNAVRQYQIDVLRQRIEQALRESEEKYRTLFESIDEGFCIVEVLFDENEKPVDYRFLVVNPAFERQTGISNAAGRRIREITPIHEERWFEVYGKIALTGEPMRFENPAEQLHHYYDVYAFRIGAPAERKVAILFNDISARKRAEEAQHRLNAELEQRVEARIAELRAANTELESFAYAVSHNLRAPLRAMSGFSHALMEDYDEHLDSNARGYLDQISLASRHMSDLIDGLLTLLRSTRGELKQEALDISVMAERLLAELAAAEPARRVAWTVKPGMQAEGDASMIEVVMRNLIDNAWKYTGKTPDATIRVYSEETEGQRCFCVTDNGAGFDMAHAGKLYHPFQHLHRQEEFPGIGIGLATVQRIVHRHGGAIRAEGALGQGATFCFTLHNPRSLERETS